MSNKPDIRFIINIEPSKYSKALDLTVNVVIMEDGKLRNPQFGWSDKSGAGEWAGIQVEARCWDDGDAFYEGGSFLVHKDSEVDLERAEALVKLMRRINKRMDALAVRFGPPADFAAKLGYLANAAGVTDKAPFMRLSSRGGWSYDDNDYRQMDVGALRVHLLTKIRDWKEGK